MSQTSETTLDSSEDNTFDEDLNDTTIVPNINMNQQETLEDLRKGDVV